MMFLLVLFNIVAPASEPVKPLPILYKLYLPMVQ
mgnify:CR=1 FL=1